MPAAPRSGVAFTVVVTVLSVLGAGVMMLVIALSGALPTIPTGGCARLSFLAGYGPEWSDLPPDLSQAVMMLATHYYEYRQDMALGAGCMPFGVTALIERYREVAERRINAQRTRCHGDFH